MEQIVLVAALEALVWLHQLLDHPLLMQEVGVAVCGSVVLPEQAELVVEALVAL